MGQGYLANVMQRNVGDDDLNTDLATAVGLCVLGEVAIPEAAAVAGVTRWELEEAIESAGIAGPLGLDDDADVASEIDDLLDGET